MREALFRYLCERPAGATTAELLDLVFTQPGSDPEFGPRFLRALLAGDPRFFFVGEEDRWVARCWEALREDLDAAEFAVVDIETTGGSAIAGGITEIGAVRLRGGRVEAEFQQLVNPGIPIAPFVTRLTGITDAMLVDQPPIAEVLPRFLEFVGDRILVAHNARFDLAFLNAAMRRHVGWPLAQPHLCTIRLARRLIPGLRRCSLDALAAHFGLFPRDRHRALGDARITADLLCCLMEQARARGVRRLDQLLGLQGQARDGRPFFCSLPRDKVKRLPASPGVYRFYAQDGRLLYVGRSTDVRRRVCSYLYNSRGHPGRVLDLIRHVASVEVEETGSELEAALREAEWIRQYKPPYNRRGKHLPRIAYLKVGGDRTFPRLVVTRRPVSRVGRLFGPFPGWASAERARDALLRLYGVRSCSGRLYPAPRNAPCFAGQVGMCSAPCAARIDAAAYGARVRGLIELLEGRDAWARAELVRRRETASATLQFEAAARAQRDLEVIDDLMRRSRKFRWASGAPECLILHPSRRARAEAYVILGGYLVHRQPLEGEGDLDRLAAWVERALAEPRRCTPAPADIERASIVAAWLDARREEDGVVLPLRRPVELAEWRPALASVARTAADAPHGEGSTPRVSPPPERKDE